MRGAGWFGFCFTGYLAIAACRTASAQQEVYHPGETYDSLQAGRDAYWDSEAERRAKIGRQLLIEQEVMRQGTWADPQARYLPVNPESYGPVTPQVYVGPTLVDVYGGPRAGAAYYGSGAAPLPVFEPWPRVPNDIYGAPYYGFVRQPIGYVKVWTGRLNYIYKPVYASPPMEAPRPAVAVFPQTVIPPLRTRGESKRPATVSPVPPPPTPAIPPMGDGADKRKDGRQTNPPKAGQEI